MSNIYFPQPVFGAAAGSRVLVAPPKYIQGPGVLQHVAGFFAASGFSRLGILASQRGHATQAKAIAEQLAAAGTEVVSSVFQGECSLEEIEAQAGSLASQKIQCLIAVGGGKCVDAGKCIAHRLAVPSSSRWAASRRTVST
ncbi:MAG: iron-containing alcohol dehydrogenase [Pseudomonadota bacterium]